MLKLSLLGAVAAIALALAVPMAVADPPVHIVAVDDFQFQSGGLSAACGTPVFISLNGTLRITLRTDKNGVLHETDTFTKWAFTISDADTSFSYKFGPGFFEYPDGVPVQIGDPSVVTFLGIDSNVPGLHAVAGRTVLAGVVIAITPDGVPIVDTSIAPPLSQVGNHVTQAEIRAAICAALAS
jgi:hypothetical protein